MTVESTIFDLLKGLVSNRVFPDTAPFDTVKPYITYSQVGGRAISYLENTLPDRKNGKFEVFVWASTRAEAASLNLAIEAAFVGSSTLQARPASAPTSYHEPDFNLYGSAQDFDIWSVR